MKVYVLRNCRSDMTSYDGFVWPESGLVECPDWDFIPQCGHGLHGFLWGVGDSTLLYDDECKYLIVEVDSDLIVDLGGKVKFPQGNVVFCTSDKYAAGAKMVELGADPTTCMFASVTSGDGGNSVTGDCGTSISGYSGTSTSGWGGTSTSGDKGTSTSGDKGTSTSGNYGTSTSGNYGTSISGEGGTSVTGHYGISISGDWGTSASRDWGTSISGDYGTSTSGCGGTVQTGKNGICILLHYDNKYIKKVLTDPKPNTMYKLNREGKFVESLSKKALDIRKTIGYNT